jgi:hypothetical protein
MSSITSPISPVRVPHHDDHTDEDKTEPFVLNDSMASNSSNAGDESPQPSSSAAGLRDEHMFRSNPIDRVNMITDDNKPIVLTELDRRFRAQHYYNNPTDEYTFLTENLIPFMGMVTVSNLLYWLHQLGEGFETTRWFAHWGWKRVFLEALQQTLCRLPYPRIYNCSNLHDWLHDLHDQSTNIALVPYPWAERPALTPFSPTTYKPITEHYCFNHRHKDLQGFIIGAQDGTDGNDLGCWQWKYRFFTELPDKVLAYAQARLPDFNFGGPKVMTWGILNNNGTTWNSSRRGFWSVCYDKLYFLHEDPHHTFSDEVPSPRVVHSGIGFSTLDQTALLPPYLTTGQSPVPTEHLQPGVFPSLTPFHFHPGYYLPRPLPNPTDPTSTYSLMPIKTKETLDSLVQDVSNLRHSVLGGPVGLSNKVEYLETWINNHVEEWGKVSSAQDAVINRVEAEMSTLRQALEASNRRVSALEQVLRESRDRVRSFFLNSEDVSANVVAHLINPFVSSSSVASPAPPSL